MREEHRDAAVGTWWSGAVARHPVGYCASGIFRSCALRTSSNVRRSGCLPARIISSVIHAIRRGHVEHPPLRSRWCNRRVVGRRGRWLAGGHGTGVADVVRSRECLNKVGRLKSSGVHSLTGLHPHGTQRDRETVRQRETGEWGRVEVRRIEHTEPRSNNVDRCSPCVLSSCLVLAVRDQPARTISYRALFATCWRSDRAIVNFSDISTLVYGVL